MPARTTKDLSQKRVVDAIKPAAARYMVWDVNRKGFGLDVWPSGRKSWIFFYRIAGQQRRMTLGTADRMAPAQAGAALKLIDAKVSQGIDPLAERRGIRAETRASKHATVAEVADRYLTSLDTRGTAKWGSEARRYYETHIGPALGGRSVRDVAVKDVRALHEALSETPVSANRLKAVLSAIMTRAIEDGDRPRELLNPAAAIDNYPETERDRYLTDEEWPRVAKAIRTLRTELKDAPAWDTRPQQLDALILLALTGARLRAVLPRRWSDIDFAEHAITVTPAHKGVSRILLGESAEAHLRDCVRARGKLGGFVFPGQQRRVGKRTARYEKDARPERAPTAISSLQPVWNRSESGHTLTELAELGDFTLHDWRRTFATVAGDVGISDHMIGGLLGHRVPGIRRRYARRTDDALRDAATKVSAEIARRLGLNLDLSRKAVPLTQKKRRPTRS
jgi:integrase